MNRIGPNETKVGLNGSNGLKWTEWIEMERMDLNVRLMSLNKSVATIKATLQLLDIYRYRNILWNSYSYLKWL